MFKSLHRVEPEGCKHVTQMRHATLNTHRDVDACTVGRLLPNCRLHVRGRYNTCPALTVTSTGARVAAKRASSTVRASI